jgi:hypothetical protein
MQKLIINQRYEVHFKPDTQLPPSFHALTMHFTHYSDNVAPITEQQMLSIAKHIDEQYNAHDAYLTELLGEDDAYEHAYESFEDYMAGAGIQYVASICFHAQLFDYITITPIITD